MSDNRDSFLAVVGEDIAKQMEPDLKLMAADIVSDFWQREALRLTAERDAALAQNAELVAQVEALKKAAVPNEHGKNRYGVDVAYFRNVINRELNRSLMDFKPSELARVFARLSRTADSKVLLEKEFIGEHLRDIQAEAGRAGFVAGFEKCIKDHNIVFIASNYIGHSENYAKRVKAGEV